MSHENGGWMNSDQADATAPHECFGFDVDSTHCGQCGWPLKPGFRIRVSDQRETAQDSAEQLIRYWESTKNPRVLDGQAVLQAITVARSYIALTAANAKLQAELEQRRAAWLATEQRHLNQIAALKAQVVEVEQLRESNECYAAMKEGVTLRICGLEADLAAARQDGERLQKCVADCRKLTNRLKRLSAETTDQVSKANLDGKIEGYESAVAILLNEPRLL